MKSMSNVDIFTIVHELNDILVGSRVDKSFQPNKDTVVMRFNAKGIGRVDLVLESGVRIHKTQYPIENPLIPPSFPMLLRKRLKGAHVTSINQHYFDRIVEIKMEKDVNYTLIIELFAKGNIILLDENNQIIMPLKRKLWSDRDISSKKEYKYPPKKGINPLNLEINELYDLFKNSDDDIIRTLAKNGFGHIYSEEILIKSKINKNTVAKDLDNNEINIIFDSINNVFKPLQERNFKSNIVLKEKLEIDNNKKEKLNGQEENEKLNENLNENEDLNKDEDLNENENLNKDEDLNENLNKNEKEVQREIAKKSKDVLPIDIEFYKKFNKKYYESFNEATDEFYSSKRNAEINSTKENVWNKKVNKFEKRLKLQEETLKDFENTIILSKIKGDILYTHYSEIENLLKTINTAREKDYPWIDIGKILKQAKKDGLKEAQIVESLDKLGNLILDIEDIKILIDSKETIEENAEIYYEKAKKAKRKIKGALIAIKNTKAQLKEMEDKRAIEIEKITSPQKRVKKDLKWFEKLRWFISSNGILVIGGRDANSNEDIVKNHLDNNDLYLHADLHGAPSVAIKLGETTKEELDDENKNQLLKESAIFGASFSSAWGNNYGSQDVYWTNPNQVSKSPESGEFLPKGSFVVRGKRNHIRGADLKIAVGIVNYQGKKIMAGPLDALKAHTENYVIIRPGYEKKEKIAKEILHKINEDNLISLDDVVRVLPSGKCEIIKK
ncbi:MAG: NFACT RNA binding domain-containing protein [Methanobrevibacter sp.]|jgi:predicted ribosome quality control (RQC) complex YloA/Tae2 family protein|nr:NFACT RNA binding domain-containing protein [Methanobrevibacter sp.]